MSWQYYLLSLLLRGEYAPSFAAQDTPSSDKKGQVPPFSPLGIHAPSIATRDPLFLRWDSKQSMASESKRSAALHSKHCSYILTIELTRYWLGRRRRRRRRFGTYFQVCAKVNSSKRIFTQINSSCERSESVDRGRATSTN